MIRINEDWIIDVDQFSYTLKKDLHTTRKRKNKDGTVTEEHGYMTKGYFGDILGALERLGDEIVRDKLIDGEYTLCGAVTAIREAKEDWKKLIADIGGGK